jgi:hypothetical protein
MATKQGRDKIVVGAGPTKGLAELLELEFHGEAGRAFAAALSREPGVWLVAETLKQRRRDTELVAGRRQHDQSNPLRSEGERANSCRPILSPHLFNPTAIRRRSGQNHLSYQGSELGVWVPAE